MRSASPPSLSLQELTNPLHIQIHSGEDTRFLGIKYSTNLRLIVLIHSTFFRERYQFAVGRCYALGRGVVQDANEAFKWYHRAAMGRCAEALYEVAQCYLTGEGTNYDPKESIYWMHQAADQGITQAQYVIGRCYEIGRTFPQDYNQALSYYVQASSKGHPGAFYQLGRYYEKGLILKQNYTQAMECYKLASEKGFPDAHYALGRLYETREFDISTSLLNMSMNQPEHVLQHKEARKYR